MMVAGVCHCRLNLPTRSGTCTSTFALLAKARPDQALTGQRFFSIR